MFLKTPLLAVAGLLLFAGSAVAATPPSFVQGPDGDASPVAGAETVERLCTGDFDRDGHADVVAAALNKLVMAHGDGTGHLGVWTSAAASCASGDLDGDGAADLVIDDPGTPKLTLVMNGRTSTIDLPARQRTSSWATATASPSCSRQSRTAASWR